jgi:hypothetical protein
MQPSAFLVKVPVTLLQKVANSRWRMAKNCVKKSSINFSLFSSLALANYHFSTLFSFCFPAIIEKLAEGEVTKK